MPIKNLRLRIKAEDKASGTLKKVALGVVGINQAMELARKAVEAFKKAWEFAKEGAEIELIRKRFDRLAESIGTTGDELSGELKVALKGTMSEMEGLALATDFMSLGLVKNQEEAIRLTAIAGDLGMNMNQLVLTLTNMTTMRFDALGVQVDGFKEKVKALEEAGHDTAEAFRLAFMEQAEDQIALVGSIAETAAGQFMMLEGRIKDVKDEGKLWIMNVILPSIVALNKQDIAIEQMNIRLALNDNILRAGLLTKKEITQIDKDLVSGARTYEDVLEELLGLYQEINPEIAMNNRAKVEAIELTKEVAEATSWLDVATRIHEEGLTLENIAAWENVAVLIAQKAAMDDLAGVVKALSPMLFMGYQQGGGQGEGRGRDVSDGGQNYPVPAPYVPSPYTTPIGGRNEMENIRDEIRRMVDSLPVAIADAVERR